MRIAIGLVFLSATILLAALVTNLVPSAREATLVGRKSLCEAVAIAASVHAREYEFEKISTVLRSVAGRNSDILSAGIRRNSGELIVEVGNHQDHWHVDDAIENSFEQVVVPIVTGNNVDWGSVEVRFQPAEAHGHGWLRVLQRPFARLFLFVSSASLLLFYVYLRKMLTHMDPSKVVPGRVRTAMDTLAGGLLVVDSDRRIALANEAFAAHLGTPPHELMGAPIDSLPWVDVAADSDCPWNQVLNTKIPQVGLPMRLQVGESEKVFITNSTPIMGNDGQIRGALSSFEDVTELEDKKAQLQASREEADRANAAKSEFLARMSHEIRTPMNAILGFTDVLRRGFDECEADREEYLDTMHSSGQYLLAIINDILDLSKLESGRMDIEHAKCSPHRVIHEVIKALTVTADEKGISLTYEPTDNVPETIISDSVRVRQIVTNLIGNAIKFTNDGGVRVVSRFDPTQDPPLFEIDIIDSGIGMPPNVLEKVFEPFAQADTSTTRSYGGTGLGLAISRRFAEALGGGVTVRSEQGKGSVFSVQLDAGPVQDVRMLSADEARATSQPHQARKSLEFHLPPSRILVVDDGVANRKLMKLILSRAGATIDTAENGQVGLEMIDKAEYDAVLMDMQMPVLDGYSATTRLRQEGYTLPVIALTGNAMRGDAEKCIAAGCTGFLPKPVDSTQLIQMLSEVLGNADASINSDDEYTAAFQVASDDEAEEGALVVPPSIAHPDVPDVESATSVTPRADCVIYSSLPCEDPEIRKIVEGFVSRLKSKVDEIEDAWNERDHATLAELGHWLKGSGPTVGFNDFSMPARALEQAAISKDWEKSRVSIDKISDIANRIDICAAHADCDSVSAS